MDNLRKGHREKPLGFGVSVLSLAMAMNVVDRYSPKSILAQLDHLACTARTDSPKEVQRIVSETALALIRQSDLILSVDSYYSNFRRTADAQRVFNALSISGRSKVDEETLINYDGKITNDHTLDDKIETFPRSTLAVVTINLCMEGDYIAIAKIQDRTELLDALSRIASGCQDNNSLISAEVLWTPQRRSEWITPEELYRDYPTLFRLGN